MKPTDHFKQHLSSDIAYSKAQMLNAILCDKEALEQLDHDQELRMDFDLEKIGILVSYIAYLERKINTETGNTGPMVYALQGQRIKLSKMIEQAMTRGIDTFIEGEYQDVDLRAMELAECEPEMEATA